MDDAADMPPAHSLPAGWSEAAVGDAVDACRRSATADPDLALAHAYKALLLAIGARMGLVQGEALLDEARRGAELALALEPRNSEVLGYAGCALADLGDAERAEPLLERAVEENPDNPQAWAALGACRLMRARVDSGVECLRRGLRVSPSDYRRSFWLTLLASGLLRAEASRRGDRQRTRRLPQRCQLLSGAHRARRRAAACRADIRSRQGLARRTPHPSADATG